MIRKNGPRTWPPPGNSKSTRYKIFTGALVAVISIHSYPKSIWAAQPIKTPVADRVVVPTKIKPMDINSASIDDLKALPGIDEAYARKIVENRPYDKKDQLISRNIIPPATYKKIKDRIITVQGTKN
jgi:DNA uptake protein ComE-like DNA-binding protein